MRRLAVVWCILFALVIPNRAWAWKGTIVRVSDGDTIVVERIGRDGAPERVVVRLYGIDTPESGGRRWQAQPYWKSAKKFLEELFVSGRVSIMDMGYDKYSRTIGAATSLPSGKNAQEELLKAGLAWVYTKYCRDCRQWKELENEARSGGLGVWGESDPVPPWEWRKGGKR